MVSHFGDERQILTIRFGQYCGSCTCPIFQTDFPPPDTVFFHVTDTDAAAAITDPPQVADPNPTAGVTAAMGLRPGRGTALLQVIVASGVPTQLALGLMLQLAGLGAFTLGNPVPLFVAIIALTDSVLLVVLIYAFLVASGERPRDVLLGDRPAREMALGLLLLPLLFLGLLMVIGTIAKWFPVLHSVPVNPYETFFHRRSDALLFALVVVVAGGVREEVQRGFILRRFHQRLGGARVGLVIWSCAFGLGHYTQGWDVAIGMAGAGAFWGWLYLRRGSVLAPIVNHAAFDLAQVVKMALMRGLSG